MPITVDPVSRRTSRTVAPAAAAMASRDSTVTRNAGSPIGVSRRLPRKPRSTYVGKPGRVGRPEDRQHCLELARVPEADAGHQARPGVDDHERGHGQWGSGDATRRASRRAPGAPLPARPNAVGRGVALRSGGTSLAPSAGRSPPEDVAPDHAPQVDQDRGERPGRRPACPRHRGAACPSATSGRANDHEVVAEPVAELDPALAEVHQVDERDGQRPRAHAPATRRERWRNSAEPASR